LFQCYAEQDVFSFTLSLLFQKTHPFVTGLLLYGKKVMFLKQIVELPDNFTDCFLVK